MEVVLKLSVVGLDEIGDYKDALESFLSSVFEVQFSVELNSEFRCAVVGERFGRICACGFGYEREMSQGKHNFKAGIVGGIAVDAKYRGQGLGKVIIESIDSHLLSIGVVHSFLFAYEPKVYQSSGYYELSVPIRYFDKQQKKWNQFVYRGGMVKSYSSVQLSEDLVVEFQGCVY